MDTHANLGKPLTDLVDTFVGVAGPNQGAAFCILPFGICNLQNGIHCQSQFIWDINSKSVLLKSLSRKHEKLTLWSCKRT